MILLTISIYHKTCVEDCQVIYPVHFSFPGHTACSFSFCFRLASITGSGYWKGRGGKGHYFKTCLSAISMLSLSFFDCGSHMFKIAEPPHGGTRVPISTNVLWDSYYKKNSHLLSHQELGVTVASIIFTDNEKFTTYVYIYCLNHYVLLLVIMTPIQKKKILSIKATYGQKKIKKF